MLPPDFIVGDDKRTVPSDYRAAAYQQLLLCSNSAKKDGRHYVDGCHHYELPGSCWIIDPTVTHFVDIIVKIDTPEVVGRTRDRESVVMIRNVTGIDVEADHFELLGRLTGQCAKFRRTEAKGTARAKSADVGTMFAIGTKIPYERKDTDMKVLSTAPYSANGFVGVGVLVIWWLTWRLLGVAASRKCSLRSGTWRETRVCCRWHRWTVRPFRLRPILLTRRK